VDEVDHRDGDRDGADLDGGVDGDPEGGWRSLPEVILAVFPLPIFSGGSLQTLYFSVFNLSAASLHDL
jgi:hypothetical protein